MRLVVSSSAGEAAAAAAAAVADRLSAAVTERGLASLALSGGRTPQPMIEALSMRNIAWDAVHVFQVDERAVPLTDPDRNWSTLLPVVDRLPEGNRHPMPVESADADVRYSEQLREVVAGVPPQIDVVHLGLGDDGHTASLVPGDSALAVTDCDVAWVDRYRGHRRLTLTLPVLTMARCQIWLVAGSAKARALKDLTTPGSSTPGALAANPDTATLFADSAAASGESQ